MTGLYVDSSALLKRVFVEAGSDDVRAVLRDVTSRSELVAASDLAWVEVSRALLRAHVPEPAQELRVACSGIARQPLTDTVTERARTIGPSQLRSLDAIHLASAVQLGVTAMLTFDDRLADAARAVGITPLP